MSNVSLVPRVLDTKHCNGEENHVLLFVLYLLFMVSDNSEIDVFFEVTQILIETEILNSKIINEKKRRYFSKCWDVKI